MRITHRYVSWSAAGKMPLINEGKTRENSTCLRLKSNSLRLKSAIDFQSTLLRISFDILFLLNSPRIRAFILNIQEASCIFGYGNGHAGHVVSRPKAYLR